MTPAGVRPGMRARLFAWQASIVSVVPIRVVLADDSLLVREGLEQVLAAEDEIEVVAVCD